MNKTIIYGIIINVIVGSLSFLGSLQLNASLLVRWLIVLLVLFMICAPLMPFLTFWRIGEKVPVTKKELSKCRYLLLLIGVLCLISGMTASCHSITFGAILAVVYCSPLLICLQFLTVIFGMADHWLLNIVSIIIMIGVSIGYVAGLGWLMAHSNYYIVRKEGSNKDE